MNEGIGTTDQPVQLAIEDGMVFVDGLDGDVQLTYSRAGGDLLLEGDNGQSFVVEGYYNQPTPADLMTPSGDIVAGQDMMTLENTAPDVQVAQTPLGIEGLDMAALGTTGGVTGGLGDPIGTIETMSGTVTITHADGSVSPAQIGGFLYQGDVIQTSDSGGVGAVFADTSSLAIGSSSHVVLDELVYDPGALEGSSVISLVEGSLDYVSGQIAKINPDAVAITTPVTTIGIRGTKVFMSYEDGSFKVVNLLEPTLEGEAAGEIVLYNQNGDPVGTINEAGLGWEGSGEDASIRMINLDPERVEFLTRELEDLLPESLIEKARDTLELQEALEEAAALTAEETRLAEEAAQGAKEAAEEKQAELEAAEEHLADLKAELAELELNGGQEANPDAYLKLLAEIDATNSLISQLKQETALAWQTYQNFLSDVEFYHDSMAEVQAALRAINERVDTIRAEVANNMGYEANSDGDTDGDGDFDIDDLNNLATAAGGKGNQDHLLGPENTEGDGGNFVPEGGEGEGEGDGQEFEPFVFSGNGDGSNEFKATDNSEEEDENNSNGPTTGDDDVQLFTLNGRVIDGYLENARVFIDVNENGSWDSGEDFTFTDGSGNFSFDSSQSGPLVIQGIEGTIDIATNLPFYGTMTAPAGSEVITPVTTLVNALMQADTSLDAAGAQALVEQVFNISPNGSLGTFDPIADAADNGSDTQAASSKVAALGVQIQNLILQAGNLLEGAAGTGIDSVATSEAVYDALAQAILDFFASDASEKTFSISNVDDIETIISNAADAVFGADNEDALNAVLNNMQAAKDLIAKSNSLIDQYIDDGVVGSDLLSSISRVAVVSNEVATGLKQLASGEETTFDPDSFLESYEDSVADAQIGNVTGHDNTAPVASDATGGAIEGGAVLEGQVTANDADGDVLTYQLVGDGVDGLTFNGDGTYTFDPTDPAYDSLGEGEELTVTFKYTATDDEGLSDQGKVTIMLTGTNDAPVAMADLLAVSPITTGDILIDADSLLANDTDVDGDELVITNFSFDTNEIESITQDEEGNIQIVKGADFSEETTFSYTVSDGQVTSQADVSFEYSEDPASKGLKGYYYSFDNDLIWENVGNLAETVKEYIASDGVSAHAEFIAKSLDFGYGRTSLDSIKEFKEFVGQSAEILSEDNTLPTGDAGILYMTGGISLSAGRHKMSVYSDDGFQIVIKGAGAGGSDIIIDGKRELGIEQTNQNFNVAEDGVYEIDIVYWDAGYAYVFDAKLDGEFLEDSVLYTEVPHDEADMAVVVEEAPIDALAENEDEPDNEHDLTYHGGEATMYGTDGEDTLNVDGDVDLDLTDGSVVLNSIENINLFNDSGENQLTIDAQAALDMAGEDGYVVIDGNGKDSVILEGSWTKDQGSENGYSIYHSNDDSGAEVRIANGIGVSESATS